MTRRGLVIGCGGPLGFAWSAAALAALEDQLEWDSRTADVLVGTSTGAETVAILGSGRSPRDILLALAGAADADEILLDHLAHDPGRFPPRPKLSFPGLGLARAGIRSRHLQSVLVGLAPAGRGDAHALHVLGDELSDGTGWTEHPATWIMTADAASGQVVALGSPGAPKADLGTAIAASGAIPGWLPPVRIDGRTYLDGVAVSAASADIVLEADVDEVIILAPMTSAGGAPARGAARIERVLRRQLTRGLDEEQRQLEAAGVKVIRIEPGADDLDAMGANFADIRRRPATLRTAARTAPTRVAQALAAATVATSRETPR